MKFLFGILALFLGASSVYASQGLVVHASEFGVGKFHRMDNQVHAYQNASAWADYILPTKSSTDKPLVVSNSDGSVSVFYSTLDELMDSVIAVSEQRNQQVLVLNIHGHGLPGAMWFPSDADTLQSSECDDWKSAASGSDQANYKQYYSAVSVNEIRQIRAFSNTTGFSLVGCTTGLEQWKAGVAKASQFKAVLASDAQIHFLSCVVGLGTRGQEFIQGIANLLLQKGGAGRVEASMNFGLGDWSMPEGMGFWDMQTPAQVNHDNSIYVKDRQDREIMQKGTIRVVTYKGSQWQSTLLADQDFLKLGFEMALSGTPVAEVAPMFVEEVPSQIRIPGTQAYINLK